MRSVTPKILVALLTFSVGVAAVAFCLIPHFTPPQSSAGSPSGGPEEVEEYAVYSTLLKELFVKDDTRLLVIQSRTQFYEHPYNYDGITSDERGRHMREAYPSVAEDTLIDFESKYMRPSQLRPKFNVPVKYTLIDKPPARRVLEDEAEIEKGDGGAPAQTLFEKYPDARGVISLSRVGFNRAGTEAFVRVEFTHCGLCGRGDHVLLGKDSGVWEVKGIFNLWVS